MPPKNRNVAAKPAFTEVEIEPGLVTHVPAENGPKTAEFAAVSEPRPEHEYVERQIVTVNRGDRLLEVTSGKRFELVKTDAREDMHEVWDELEVKDVTPEPVEPVEPQPPVEEFPDLSEESQPPAPVVAPEEPPAT